jgi:type IV secretory pathway VirB4 component
MYEANRTLAQDCGPVLVTFDEVWMFGRESGIDERSQPYINELEGFIRTVRSKGGLVDLATQSAADLITHRNVILANCASWIVTPGKDIRTPTGQDLLLRFGLEREHIELLQNAQRKRDYLLIDQYGGEMIDFMADPVTVAICGSGDKRSLLAAQQVLAEYGEDGFLQGWLRYSGNKALKLGLKQDAEELFAAAKWAADHEGEMLPLNFTQAAE